MIDQNKLNMLLALLERERIALEDIKNEEYKEAAKAALSGD